MFIFQTAAERRADALAETRRREAKEKPPVPWDPEMKWQPALKIFGKSYRQRSLFKVKASGESEADPNIAYNRCSDKFECSPNLEWAYRERVLPAGSTLETFSGRKRGAICFDSKVIVPMIHKNIRFERGGVYWSDPIMSLTPMEYFSLRPGIRAARGRVIVAGLGMGYMLEKICSKSNVEHVTLVEKSQEIVDWIFPKIDTYGKPVDILVGDAYKIVPTLDADVALIDIFPTYGGNRQDWEMRIRAHERRTPMKQAGRRGMIKKIWIWGA